MPLYDMDQQWPFLKASSVSSRMYLFFMGTPPPKTLKHRGFFGGSLSLVTLFFSETSLFPLHRLGEDLSTLILKEILEQSICEGRTVLGGGGEETRSAYMGTGTETGEERQG